MNDNYYSKMNKADPHAKFLPDRKGRYDPYAYQNFRMDTGGRNFYRGNQTFPRAPLTAGYDNGNTRVPNTMPPIGGPFVPFGGMDYTGRNTGMRMASMDPGSKYNGTYKQEGYGDPRFDDFGQEEYYDNRDYYMDDVIDPGLSGYDRGPLYFS